MASISESLAIAHQHLQRGHFSEAEQLCRQILQQQAEAVEAWYLLGMATHRAGKLADAIACYQQVLVYRPQNPQVYNNLGVAFKAQGQLETAVRYYRQALALKPDYPEVHNNLGNVLRQQGNFAEAIAHYQQALQLAPHYLDASHNLGNTLREQGNIQEAIAHFQQEIHRYPDNPDLHNNLGNALQGIEDFAGAIACYRKALELRPNDAAFLSNLGAALQELGQLPEAIATYQQALAMRPDYADAYYNLGNALKDADQLEEAIAAYRQSIELDPHHAETYNNMGLALCDHGQLTESIAAYRQALSLRNNYPDAHLNLALSLLLAGELQAGFAEYEWRWQVKGPNFKAPRNFTQPLWNGEALNGQTILLHAEQGFGDTLQFIRYAPLVAAWGGNVVVEAPAPLLLVLEGVPGVAQWVTKGDRLPEFQVHAPLLSLPHLLGTTPETIPAQVPYLHPPTDTAIELKSPADTHFKVGFVWAGSPTHANDAYRSCTLEQLQQVFTIPAIAFYSLQKGPQVEQLQPFQTQFAIQDLDPQLQDFADTAAAIAQLDLVITVDTSVAHLAGAMGKPVWVLLSSRPDWRWMFDWPDSSWYPTLRLFRQTSPRDWSTVIDQVAASLQELVDSSATADDYLRQGNQLRREGDRQQAILSYQQSLTLDPQDPNIHNNLGVTLKEQGHAAGAISHYRQSLHLQPQHADAHYNLANSLRDQGLLDLAINHYQQAVAHRPHHLDAWNNLGNTLKDQNRLQEAIACYQNALAINPDHASAHHNLGYVLLLLGDLQQGFAEYEWRWRVKNFKPPRDFEQPLWDGTNLTGKTILLYAEQGFGDTIQFIRYAAQLAQQGGRVIVECQASLLRLLQTAAGVDQWVSRGELLPEFDTHAPLLSLPYHLGTTLETIPSQVPYLSPPASDAVRLRSRPDTQLKVGLVWAGSPTHRNDHNRSCGLAPLLELLQVSGVQFYSLQKGPRSADLAQQDLTSQHIDNLSEQLDDFADTAAAIAQLDLVISVDTAVAHLAGALAKPVWVLQSFAPDWRWMLDRSDSPWYPTMRLFRQQQPGDWAGVVAAVKAALVEMRSARKVQAQGEEGAIALQPTYLEHPTPIGIGWELSAVTGWGIYGTNLTLQLLKRPDLQPIPLLPPLVETPFNPLHWHLLQPAFQRQQQISDLLQQHPQQQIKLEALVLKGLGNDFVTTPELARIWGKINVGVIFLEDTHLSSAALQRAQAFDLIVVGSTWNEQVLRSHGLTQVQTVHQGVDPTIFHPAPKSGILGDRFVIFSGGKLEYRKGQDLVIKAFQHFQTRHPEALLVTAWHNRWPTTMAGLNQAGHVQGLPKVDAQGRLQIKEWLVANGIRADAVIDLGVIPNHLVGQILREADVAVFPNRCEGGTNLAAMESLACGIPTVLSANTGHLDLIQPGSAYPLHTQTPISSGNPTHGSVGWGESDIEEIIETLETIHANRHQAQIVGAAAANMMQSWSWERQVKRLLAVLAPLQL